MGLITKRKDTSAEFDAMLESLGVDIDFLNQGKSLDNEDEDDEKEEKKEKDKKENNK